MRDVEAVAASAHRPRRRDCTRRRDDAVVLESAEGHARRGVGRDVEVVEQCGLETASVERREVDAGRAPEDASVIAAIDDGEGTGLRRESPMSGCRREVRSIATKVEPASVDLAWPSVPM